MARKDRLKERYKDIIQDTAGNLIYTGESFRIAGDSSKVRAVLIIWLLVIAALVIGSGCIDAAGANSAFYVILPFIGEAAALFALAWNAVKVIYGRDSVRKYVLDAANERIPGACRILAVFAGLGMILSAVYLMKHGMEGETFKSVLYPVLKLAAAAAAEYYRRIYTSVEWIRSQ